MQELNLITSENFGEVQCDFYQSEDNFYMTREQIGAALEYKYPQNGIDVLHRRHKDRFDQFSVPVKLTGTDGKTYDTTGQPHEKTHGKMG